MDYHSYFLGEKQVLRDLSNYQKSQTKKLKDQDSNTGCSAEVRTATRTLSRNVLEAWWSVQSLWDPDTRWATRVAPMDTERSRPLAHEEIVSNALSPLCPDPEHTGKEVPN